MQTLMKPTIGARVFSGLLDLHADKMPKWIPSPTTVPEYQPQRPTASGCCSACGQALRDIETVQDTSPSIAQRHGIEVLSVRAGWRRRSLVRWEEIEVASCNAKYINVHDKDGLVHLIEFSLDRICEHAGPNLVRVHRGHAINPKYLSSVVSRSDSSCDFVMQSGITVPGSRRLTKPARIAIFGEAPRRRSTDR
jgi:DNA-binding LytR/AlgR family response regulator